MKDTSSAIEKKVIILMKMRSNLDRLKMGAEMFDTARALVKLSLNKIPKEDLPSKLFLRFYGADFDQVRREKIAFIIGSK